MENLSLRLLGNFEATLGERPFTKFRTAKVQALLVFLVVEETKVNQRESLQEFLWPDLPQQSAQVNLRQILYQLKKALPKLKPAAGEKAVVPLITDRKTIQLNPNYPISSDATRLANLLQKSWRHGHADLLTCAPCRTWLEQAVDLYQGDFLADFSIYDSNSFEAWAQAKRETLRRQTLDAMDVLTQIHLAEEDFQQAEKTARRQLGIDNLRENAYRQLMQILASTGRRSEALSLYETCRRLLAEELGMSPARKTTALSEQIKGGSLSLVTNVRQGIRGYDVGDKLGEGAFGAVYKAYQKGIGREVAIKIIHAKYANQPRFIRRFEAEAQMVARLEYPHIVPLYDYWRESDSAFLVMRWLRGGSLQDLLKRGHLEINTAVTFVTQIAGALHAAHRQRIIHRDVKPANILLDNDGNAYLSDFGIARDSSAENHLTEAHEVLGSPNYISPEQLLGEEITPAADMYALGLVLYAVLTGGVPYSTSSMVELIQKQINEPLPLVAQPRSDLPPILDDVIQQATAKKAADRFPDMLSFSEALSSAIGVPEGTTGVGRLRATAVAETEIINPYKGLQAFQVQDADHFYGRQALIEQLLDRLSPATGPDAPQGEERFLALVGPSGSGKSSVVKAGLIPALQRGALPGSADWFVVEMSPGSYPLEELEAALFRVAVNPPPSLLEPLQKDKYGLVRVLKRLLPQERDADRASQLLLVIDQFEELFTLVQHEADRNRFLDSLFAAVIDANSRLRVIITLRADFYDRPLQLPRLGDWLRRRTELVLPLTVAELEQAITAPAVNMGVSLEAGLAAEMIAEVHEQPGALPLMQYALTELFERRDGRMVPLDTYEAIGGVTGALARRADEIYKQLDEAGQAAAQQLFLRLVTLGEGVEDTRRRVHIAELQTLDEDEDNWLMNAVTEAFGKYRLLTFDRDPMTRDATVEVAHEALLREWPRLRGWLDESRGDVRQQRLLAEATQQWLSANQDESYLLRGGRLAEFESWQGRSAVALTANEKAFLSSSLEARTRRQTAEKERHQRELETAQQLAEAERRRAEEQAAASQTLRQRALFLAGASVLAVILAIAAFGFANSSGRNANIAATSAAEAAANLTLAETREAEAVNERDRAAAESEARATQEAVALAERDRAEAQTELAESAEAIALENQQLAETQLRLTTSRELAFAANASMETDPERSLLLAIEALENAYTTEAEEVLRIALQNNRKIRALVKGEEPVYAVDYHPSGLWIAGAEEFGDIIVWDPATGEQIQIVSVPLESVTDIKFSPDGSYLAVATGSQILVLDTNSWGVIQILEGHEDSVISIAFHPDGDILASGGEDGWLKTWLVTSGELLVNVMATDEGRVSDLEFSRDGSRIATDVDDSIVRLWDPATGKELLQIQSIDASGGIAFSLDGNRLFVSEPRNEDGSEMTIWDISKNNTEAVLTQAAATWFDMHGRNFVHDVALSPDGRYLATFAQGDNTVKLWDAENDSTIEIMTLAGHQGSPRNIAFNPDGQTLVSATGTQVWLWDVSDAGRDEVLAIADSSFPIAFTSDDQQLVTISNNYATASPGTIKIWEMATGSLVTEFDTQNQAVKSAAVSANGNFLAIGGENNEITIWDLNTQQALFFMKGHEVGIIGGVHRGVMSLEFSSDESLLASAGADGTVFVWDVATGEAIYSWRVDPRESFWEPGPNGAIRVRFSPDGHLLAVSSDNGDIPETDETGSLIKLWDLSIGEEILTIQDTEWIWGLAFSADGRFIAGSSILPTAVGIWDVTSGEQIARIAGSATRALFAEFSANGNQLITSGGDITIWDIPTESVLLSLPQVGWTDAAQVWNVFALSSDGKYLAAQGNNQIQIFALDFDELFEIAKARVTRTLTEAECQQYLHVATCPEDE